MQGHFGDNEQLYNIVGAADAGAQCTGVAGVRRYVEAGLLKHLARRATQCRLCLVHLLSSVRTLSLHAYLALRETPTAFCIVALHEQYILQRLVEQHSAVSRHTALVRTPLIDDRVDSAVVAVQERAMRDHLPASVCPTQYDLLT